MIIAHDLGTTGNKASLHSDDGKMLQHCTISYPAGHNYQWVLDNGMGLRAFRKNNNLDLQEFYS